jgi:leucyl-tRNA synthetase
MLGENVLFPMAFHATGTPIVGLSELIANRDPSSGTFTQSSTGYLKRSW